MDHVQTTFSTLGSQCKATGSVPRQAPTCHDDNDDYVENDLDDVEYDGGVAHGGEKDEEESR